MPRNSNECIQWAIKCAELAAQTTTEGLKTRLVSLSKAWEGMAIELERAQAIVENSDAPLTTAVNIIA
jgi:hypothetical protein